MSLPDKPGYEHPKLEIPLPDKPWAVVIWGILDGLGPVPERARFNSVRSWHRTHAEALEHCLKMQDRASRGVWDFGNPKHVHYSVCEAGKQASPMFEIPLGDLNNG
jgi:hypothetical protein